MTAVDHPHTVFKNAGIGHYLAPAVFIGVQSGFGVMPDIELWNLTANIKGHSAGATLSRETIIAAGYILPLRNAA